MKKNILFTYLLMLIIMSSCGVYSLFPIYTADTLVEKEELIGKWVSDDEEGNYINFSKISYSINSGSKGEAKDSDLKISFGSEDDKSVVDTDHYVIENGDTTVFKDTILTQFEELLEKKIHKLKNYDGGDKKDTYYTMRFFEENEEVASFKAHLVKIGEDLFIDLLPQGGLMKDNGASDNYFPVHTFLKIKLSDTKLSLKSFDQGKLKDLFKSNLIRIRHEIVDDKVLITAQPKEIQKFLEKYSKDESVFEDISDYTKVNS